MFLLVHLIHIGRGQGSIIESFSFRVVLFPWIRDQRGFGSRFIDFFEHLPSLIED